MLHWTCVLGQRAKWKEISIVGTQLCICPQLYLPSIFRFPCPIPSLLPSTSSFPVLSSFIPLPCLFYSVLVLIPIHSLLHSSFIIPPSFCFLVPSCLVHVLPLPVFKNIPFIRIYFVFLLSIFLHFSLCSFQH